MPRRRQSHEPGHRRKFLVLADDTPECDRALYYAARRAARTGGAVVLLAVLQLEEAPSQWLGVADLMRAEATDKAEARLDLLSARAEGIAGVDTERVVREGTVADQILAVIEEDEDIAILVLAAGTGKEGPGPLIASLAKGMWASLPVPVTLVPGALSDSEIDALA
ncbi:universal stress protein [Ancylobacter polymorphus]|jgi:nucleotide-binding universal stress UspA family protein|uniref:Nucleotide-binding universal stress UspA family protein n=1 Tax=Ancylobacter polymorphus TaxID=223390 RepID=A0ABU0B886_9HYPH|nr:universal stress protein [Ancylobacter polymorphus]MDQ0302041.1 nucleotide-binding universal stress UspA family protein [Ancylobacter polymorphus]MPT25017.1 universal stress protein [Starkeya sp.]